MYYRLVSGTPLYRVTSQGVDWPNPVRALGAFYTAGGRYNGPSQPTVYCTEDPISAIAEAAFYEALEWQYKISRHRNLAVSYPLVSTLRFWAFSISPAPTIIDLAHPQSFLLFQHTYQMLLNPGLNPASSAHRSGRSLARDYLGTQELANEVRAFIPPRGSPDPRPEGLRAPAVRSMKVGRYRPHQLALFVIHPDVHDLYENRSERLIECDVQIEFMGSPTRRSVTARTVEIDWQRPRFRLAGPDAAIVPAYLPRPKSRPLQPNRWYDLDIRFV